MTPIVPRGTPIAVIAPSHAYDPAKLEAGLAIARAHGHDLRPFPGMLHPHRYFAAPVEVRRAQLVEALTDDRYGAVWLVRGGSGLLQVLGDMPWGGLRRKPVIGFSDVVALHLALERHDLGPSVHGPVLHSLVATDEASIDRALVAIAGALRPGGVLVIDLCDLEWGERRPEGSGVGRLGDGWAVVTEFSMPRPDRFVRQIAAFLENPDGSWRRDDERHDNVLLDTSRIPALLAEHGVEATVESSFGSEQLPTGLYVVKGRRNG